MGQTCSACQTKPQGKLQIVHIDVSTKKQNEKPLQKTEITSIDNVSLSSKHLQSTKKTKSPKQYSDLFEIKYTTSFSQISYTPTSKTQIVDNKSVTTTQVMKEIKGPYLEQLFIDAKQKVLNEEPLKIQKSDQNLAIPNQIMQPSLKLKRLTSTKSQNNKIDREQFIRICHDNINEKYSYSTKIGQGSFGFVYKGNDKITKEQRAIKIIKKKRLAQKGRKQALFAQLEILREIDHPNIIKLYDVIENKSIFYIVTQYCDGGELLQTIRRAKHFTQGSVSHVMSQIISALNYLHKKGIMHRDLKPQNIVLEFKSPSGTLKQPPIKIIDFGTATYFKSGDVLKAQIGSTYYIAPQVIKQQYNQKCDIWSAGIIMYILLCGFPPFRGRTQKQIFEAILKGKIVMQGGIWNKISASAKDLLKQMLDPNPNSRISAQEILKHKWMTQFQHSNVIQAQVLNNMQKFFFKNKFRAVIETFLAMKTITQQDRRLLTDKFKEMDKDNSGVLEIHEVIEAYKSIYGQTNQDDVKKILQNIDTDRSGNIELTEFIVATIQHQKLFKRKALENAWTFFDIDKTGYLDMEEMGLIIGDSTQNELKQIMDELGAEGGLISKQKFMKVFESKDDS